MNMPKEVQVVAVILDPYGQLTAHVFPIRLKADAAAYAADVGGELMAYCPVDLLAIMCQGAFAHLLTKL